MTTPNSPRSLELLSAGESLLVVVDMQERLLPHIANAPVVRDQCVRLLRAAELFDVPAVLTEQYPGGLGSSDPELIAVAPARERPEKLRFSGAGALGWPPAAERDDARMQVVIAGIETHICVLQTALDLLSAGYRVFIVADAVGSQRPTDHEPALARLRDSGATITTTESVLFEWCEEAGTERFRALRRLL